jgi:hypothetical protein
MSSIIRLPHQKEIYQYLIKQRFDLYVSKPGLAHMVHFIYAWGRYEKEGKSKIEMVCDWIQTLPIFNHSAYVLADAWYTSKQLVNVSIAKGLYLILYQINIIFYPELRL